MICASCTPMVVASSETLSGPDGKRTWRGAVATEDWATATAGPF
ncbi:MAG TPA: hypothetical protein VNK05_14725 [Chloroflexota bacterium]|nr:hypothetical protein [Chloroflexota bacterium]